MAFDDTDANGDWAIGPGEAGDAALTAAEDRDAYDVELRNGTDRIWWNADDEVQVKTLQLWNADANEYALSVTRTEDVASVEVAYFEGDRATPADNDAAYIDFRLSDSAGTQRVGARIEWIGTTILTGATGDTDLLFHALVNNTLTEFVRLDGSASEILGASGIDVNLTASSLRWASGVALVGTEYSIQRDADGTNQLHFNVPTGATYEWSVNDAVEMTLSATAVNFQNNSITTTGGGSLTGTWSDLGTVTTVDINGGTLDGAVIGGASAAAATVTTLIVNTSANPDADDGAVLGASGTAWSDLFLASGAVINFAAGDVTLTHAANALTLDGGDYFVANNNGVVIGAAAQVAIGSTTPEFQAHGTTVGDASAFIGRWSANSDQPLFFFGKSRSATIGTFSIITSGDVLGDIQAYGDDGVDFENAATSIRFVSSGTIAADRIPGEIRFLTATDAAPSVLTQRWTIDNAGSFLAAAGYVIKAGSATEIGIQVANGTLVVGSAGSLVIPYLSSTGAAFTDAIGGDLDGAIGINYDNDTGPTTTIEVRSQASWLSVAVTGYSINRHIPLGDSRLNREVAWWHDAQIKGDHIDESVCIVCGEQMHKHDQITMWANYDRERDLHAAFGHLHLEANPQFSELADRVEAVEQAVELLRQQVRQSGLVPVA